MLGISPKAASKESPDFAAGIGGDITRYLSISYRNGGLTRFPFPSPLDQTHLTATISNTIMIENDEQLRTVKQQLERVESALHSLKQRLRPQREATFRLLSQGYVGQISALRREIDEYRGTVQ
jgi:hypothetical protein